MTDLAPTILLFLFLAAFVAGFIDSIAGGGGLITVPAMLLAGIPPLETLGTNKLQSLFGSSSATLAYARRGHVRVHDQWPMFAMAVLGGGLGAVLATVVPGDVLKAIMPFMLVVIGLYFALKPRMSDEDRQERITPFLFGLTAVPLIAFYDGVFGPGTGSFFMLAFVSLAGFGILKATAHTKMLNFGSNIGAFLIFLANGVILWKAGHRNPWTSTDSWQRRARNLAATGTRRERSEIVAGRCPGPRAYFRLCRTEKSRRRGESDRSNSCKNFSLGAPSENGRSQRRYRTRCKNARFFDLHYFVCLE